MSVDILSLPLRQRIFSSNRVSHHGMISDLTILMGELNSHSPGRQEPSQSREVCMYTEQLVTVQTQVI